MMYLIKQKYLKTNRKLSNLIIKIYNKKIFLVNKIYDNKEIND